MSVLKLELYKMFHKKNIKVVILVSLFVIGIQTYSFYVTQRKAVNQTYEYVMNVENGVDEKMDFYENSFIEGWIGCETYTPYSTMLYLIMPLLASMPFAMSQYDEWKNGYASQIITRCGRKRYMNAKYIAVFFSGGIVIAIPLLVSMVVSMCYMPIIKIDPLAMQSKITLNDMFGYIYTYYPVGYVLLYTFIDFLYGGILACMAMLVSGVAKNWFTAMTFPAVLTYFLYYGVGELSVSKVWLRTYNFSYFIRPNQNGESSLRQMPFLIITLALLVIEYFIYYIFNIKRETVKR